MKDFKQRRRIDDKTAKGEFRYMLLCGVVISGLTWLAIFQATS